MSESLLGGSSAPAQPAATETPNTGTPAPAAPTEIKIPENWKAALPEDLQKDPSMASIMDIASLAKSYVHGQKMIGRDKIVIPDKFATDEDWQKVFQKLGVPDSPEKYELKVAENADPEFVKGFKDLAVKNGILPKHAEKLFEFYNNHVEKSMAAQEELSKKSFEESVNGLKKEWGQGYERKIQAASGLFNKLADPETKDFFNKTGLGNDPVVIKLFAKLAGEMGEDKFVDGASTGSMGLTPAEAKQKINDIFGNKDHPYFNKAHPSHKDALAEVNKLFEATYTKS
jgi:hypothetical protein